MISAIAVAYDYGTGKLIPKTGIARKGMTEKQARKWAIEGCLLRIEGSKHSGDFSMHVSFTDLNPGGGHE